MVRSVAGRQSNALYCPGARPAGTNGFVPRMNLWPETRQAYPSVTWTVAHPDDEDHGECGQRDQYRALLGLARLQDFIETVGQIACGGGQRLD